MNARIARNRCHLRDLFAGPFPGHALTLKLGGPDHGGRGDFLCSDRPVHEWVRGYAEDYRAQLRFLDECDCDNVPYVGLNTNTGLFAAAFGCPVHVYEGRQTNAAARPIVNSPEEADRLPQPTLDAPTLSRVLELARLLRRELGPEAPIGVPDIQSPFDIAAIVWNKEDLFPSLIEAPEAVEGLVHKCFRLLTDFLQTFRREIGEVNFCHCPYAWAPPELGCWLSEDEAGSMNVGMFERFCLPTLNALSDTFGGLFMHCCATADHQYGSFGKIRNLRGLNRVFQKPGAKPAIDAFSGRTVLVQAWMDEAALNALLEMAHPDTRFLFNLSVEKPEQAVPLVERLRKRCPRQAANAPREKAVAG